MMNIRLIFDHFVVLFWICIFVTLQTGSCQRPGMCPSLALSYPACLMGMQQTCNNDNDCQPGYKCCACGTRSTCQMQASSPVQAVCPLDHIDTGMPCNFNYECMEQLGECCYNNDHCVRPTGANVRTCPDNHRDTGTRCTTDNQCNVLRGECCYQAHHCVLPVMETSLFCPHDHRDTGRSCTYDQDCNMFDNECCYQRHHCVVPRRVQTCPAQHRDTGRVCRTDSDCNFNRGECCFNSEHCVIPVPQATLLRDRFTSRFPNGLPTGPMAPGMTGMSPWGQWGQLGQQGPWNPSISPWGSQFMGQGLMGPMRPGGGSFWGPVPSTLNMNNRWGPWAGSWGGANPWAWGPSLAGMTGQFPTTMTGQFPSTMGGQFPSTMGGQFPTTMGGQFPSTMGGQFPSTMGGMGMGSGFNPSVNTGIGSMLPGLGGGPWSGQFSSSSVPVALTPGITSGHNHPSSGMPNSLGPVPVSPLSNLLNQAVPGSSSTSGGNLVGELANMAANLLSGP